MFLSGKNRKRNIVMIVVLSALFIALLGLLYNTYWKDTGISLVPGVVVGGKRVRPIDTSFDKTFLENQKFRSLKQFVDLPIIVGAKGKENPFKEQK